MPNTIKRNLVIGFGFALVLLLVSSAASFFAIKGLVSASKSVDHTHNVISQLEEINKLLYRAESSQRGFLVTGNGVFLESYGEVLQHIDDKLKTIDRLTKDNSEQQANLSDLDGIIDLRFAALQRGIDVRTQNNVLSDSFMKEGKLHMENAQDKITEMEGIEQALLQTRLTKVQRLSAFTPILIVLASLIALVITFVFYTRIIRDQKRRHLLHLELEQKDQDLNDRINAIQSIAEQISGGNYSVRVDQSQQDVLGSLAGELNKMAASLEYSFTTLSDREKLQAGVADLNSQIIGEQYVDVVVYRILQFVARYTNSKVGAFYLKNEGGSYSLTARYALPEKVPLIVKEGEGLVGQCAKEGKMLRLENIPDGEFKISLATGSIKPVEVIVIPVIFEGDTVGVIELGTLQPYTNNDILFLQTVTERAGIAVNTSQSRRKLQELLEETQSQAEELQVQHSELEHMNDELKNQSQRLQVSEEELRVQQEELLQTNAELEERSALLEEKNQMIEERNREIQATAVELAQSTRYKSEFLANMSHELRTPLNSILLLSRLLVENAGENLTEDQMEYARVIQTSGQGLLTLIDEILDLSRIEAGKMEVDFQVVSVREVTNDLQSLFAPLAKDKGLDFMINIAPDVSAKIETDKMKLDQILRNLISNALKFTATGYVKLDVRQTGNEPSMLEFCVVDTGIGIDADKQKIIFNAFQQADGSTRRQFGGTGLGLAISKEFSRLLGGDIILHSESGKGSSFCLVIPVSKPAVINYPDATRMVFRTDDMRDTGTATGIEEAVTVEEDEVLMTEDDSPGKMSKVIHRIENILKKEPRKVLLLEENAKHAKALAYFLENFGIDAMIRHDVSTSIDVLLEKEGNCVILDTGTTASDTIEQLQTVKKTPGLELLPIIVFTGRNLSRSEEARMKEFANSIVLKTAHSYQRILDEVSLYLHLTSANKNNTGTLSSASYHKSGSLREVLNHKKVLIADDDVRNIFSLSKALEPFGMKILSAMDGKEALQQLEQDPHIDVVLMDMMMPEMDGYQTMNIIRSKHAFRRLPIIAVTAKAMAGDREKCISAGASDYITKPIDKDQLLSLLRVWLYDRG